MAWQEAPKSEAALVPGRERAVESTLLIDQFLSRYDHAVIHAEVFRAPPDACYRAAREVDLLRHPVIRTLLGLRSLPERLTDLLVRHRSVPTAAPPRTFRLDDMVGPPINWVLLGEEPNVELVLGQISRPWKPIPASSGPSVTPDTFAAFDQPGFAKIALSLRVVPYGAAGSILTMETRVALTDPESRRQFARYWALIGPFSSLIRHIALQLVAADLRRSR